MIRADLGENFIISVALWDESTGENASGKTVRYDIRDDSDAVLAPPMSGILPESTVTSGIYFKELSINTDGDYICYATCDDFFSSSEEIIINPENIYALVKQNRNYNISVEDVIRTDVLPIGTQALRQVPLNKTDYIVTVIKGDGDGDWSTTTVSGIVYAWYRSTDNIVPYKMGPES